MAQRKDIIIGARSSWSERMGEYFSHKLLGVHRKVGWTFAALFVLILIAVGAFLLWKGDPLMRSITERIDPALVAEEAESVIAGRDAMGRADYADAVKYFTRVAELNPKSIEAWMTLATAQLRQGNDEAALAALLRRNEIPPEDAMSHFLCVRIYQRMGKNAEALQAAREAVRLAPLNPLYTNTLYIMRIQNGELEQVREELNRMAALSRTLEPTFIFGRAAVALASGDENGCIRYVLRARHFLDRKTFTELFYNDFFKPVVDRLTKAMSESMGAAASDASADTTPAPTTPAPSTPAPTVAPATPAPSTPAPTVAPATPAPSTPAPTVAPATPAPTVETQPEPTPAQPSLPPARRPLRQR